jgi:uroporphyrinogen-III synthase
LRLLLTRPQPDAERTADVLRTRGHVVHLASLLRSEAIAADLGEERFGAVVMTSANAARALAAHPAHLQLIQLPLYAVGCRTAAAARAAGFTDIVSAQGNLPALALLIGARDPQGPLLYLAGADRAGDLAALLKPQGVAVRTLVVYRAVAADRLPSTAATALRQGGIDGVLHFSRRTAETYLACARAAALLAQALAPVHYCLSGRVAEPLAAAGAERIAVAPSPRESALLALIPAAVRPVGEV